MFQRSAIVLLILSGVGSLSGEEVRSDRDPKAATMAAYQSAIESGEGATGDVAAIRLALAEAYEELSRENALLTRTQQELERKDPIARGLREKLVALEKELVEVRRSLQVRLEAIDEISEIEARRRKLIEHVQELRQEERRLVAAAEQPAASEPGEHTGP